MELLVALYTTPVPFEPTYPGWWMLWHLRIALPMLPLLCLAGHITSRVGRR